MLSPKRVFVRVDDGDGDGIDDDDFPLVLLLVVWVVGGKDVNNAVGTNPFTVVVAVITVTTIALKNNNNKISPLIVLISSCRDCVFVCVRARATF